MMQSPMISVAFDKYDKVRFSVDDLRSEKNMPVKNGVNLDELLH
jgi:hypothetical protein